MAALSFIFSASSFPFADADRLPSKFFSNRMYASSLQAFIFSSLAALPAITF
jgi:hypothetical protein